MKLVKQQTFIFLSIFISSLAFAENIEKSGLTIKQSNILKLPQYKADLHGIILPDKHVTVKKRQRAWYQISNDNYTNGWVKMTSIRLTGVAKRKGELGVKKMVDSITGKLILPTASTGIRGFDEADLKKAAADIEQVKVLESFSISKKQAQIFARQGNLELTNVSNKEGEK